MEDKSLRYLDNGIRVGTGLAALAIARGLIRGTHLGVKGMHFKVKDILKEVKHVGTH